MKSASCIIQDNTPVQSGADSHAAGVTLLTAATGVILSHLGWPLTRPAVQLFKENREAETTLILSS